MELTNNDLKQECKYCYREVDASGLEAFRCTNKTVNMETSWCRPKNANEPCSKCDYCKPKEEMGMTIDDAIEWYGGLECYTPQAKDARNVAVETMRKYQKIEQIVDRPTGTYVEEKAYNYMMIVEDIKEVLEDGKID